MKNQVWIGFALIAAALPAGCKGGPHTLQEAWESMWGPSPQQSVAMVFDVKDPDQRREGIVNLSRNDWGLREPYLKGYAKVLETDEDAVVRSVAVRALGKSGDVTYLPNVVEALADPSPNVRLAAAAALDRLVPIAQARQDPKADTAARPLQRQALIDTSVDVRAECLKTLQHYRDTETAATMVRCLGEPSFTVRHQAHESLVHLFGEDRGYEPADWSALLDEALPPPPPRQGKRPWWDWAGVTEDDSPRPAPRPKTKPADAEKPWWDWMGVTESDEPEASAGSNDE